MHTEENKFWVNMYIIEAFHNSILEEILAILNFEPLYS